MLFRSYHCQPQVALHPPEERRTLGPLPHLQHSRIPPLCVCVCSVLLCATPALLGPGAQGHCLAQPQAHSAPAGCGIGRPGAAGPWPRCCLTRSGAPSLPRGAREAGTHRLACPLASAFPQPLWQVSAAEGGQGGLCGQLGRADPCAVSPAEGEVSAEEEGFENLNTMASTFIVLFLLSLFYSTTVTLFKVGRRAPGRA